MGRYGLYRIAPGTDAACWGHPGGYRIVRHVRDWTLRGLEPGVYAHTADGNPKVWWAVTSLGRRRSSAPTLHEATSLREAAAWCDTH